MSKQMYRLVLWCAPTCQHTHPLRYTSIWSLKTLPKASFLMTGQSAFQFTQLIIQRPFISWKQQLTFSKLSRSTFRAERFYQKHQAWAWKISLSHNFLLGTPQVYWLQMSNSFSESLIMCTVGAWLVMLVFLPVFRTIGKPIFIQPKIPKSMGQ